MKSRGKLRQRKNIVLRPHCSDSTSSVWQKKEHSTPIVGMLSGCSLPCRLLRFQQNLLVDCWQSVHTLTKLEADRAVSEDCTGGIDVAAPASCWASAAYRGICRVAAVGCDREGFCCIVEYRLCSDRADAAACACARCHSMGSGIRRKREADRAVSDDCASGINVAVPASLRTSTTNRGVCRVTVTGCDCEGFGCVVIHCLRSGRGDAAACACARCHSMSGNETEDDRAVGSYCAGGINVAVPCSCWTGAAN